MSDKADMMTGPNAAMRCPLPVSEFWPLSGKEGSTRDPTPYRRRYNKNACPWDLPAVPE
jgi:hypothetical protein